MRFSIFVITLFSAIGSRVKSVLHLKGMKRNAKKQILFPGGPAVEVVVGGGIDANVVETTAQKPLFRCRNQDLLIHFGRVVLRASHVVIALPRVDQYPLGPADATQVVFERYFVLKRHDPFDALLFDLFRNVVLQFLCRIGAFLLRIGEDPQPLEAYVAHELFQLGEIGLRLAGIADQERGAQRQIGDGFAQASDQRIGVGFGVAPLLIKKFPKL